MNYICTPDCKKHETCVETSTQFAITNSQFAIKISGGLNPPLIADHCCLRRPKGNTSFQWGLGTRVLTLMVFGEFSENLFVLVLLVWKWL